jgi:cbb3-type cytochrome oxidase maturation protein
MSVIVVLIGFSICIAGGFLIAFLWAVRSGQYDDRHTPAIRMLFDNRPSTNKSKVSRGDH